MLATLVAERRHECLSLLIASCGSVLKRLDQNGQLSFWNQLSNAMGKLLAETEYHANDEISPFSIGMKLRIRVACTRLVHRLLELGHSDPTLDQWVASIRTDQFADVRREINR